jgi:hypothetical protein
LQVALEDGLVALVGALHFVLRGGGEVDLSHQFLGHASEDFYTIRDT